MDGEAGSDHSMDCVILKVPYGVVPKSVTEQIIRDAFIPREILADSDLRDSRDSEGRLVSNAFYAFEFAEVEMENGPSDVMGGILCASNSDGVKSLTNGHAFNGQEPTVQQLAAYMARGTGGVIHREIGPDGESFQVTGADSRQYWENHVDDDKLASTPLFLEAKKLAQYYPSRKQLDRILNSPEDDEHAQRLKVAWLTLFSGESTEIAFFRPSKATRTAR